MPTRSESEILACFAQVQSQLVAMPWFQTAGWTSSTHPFPALATEGITFQVFKPGWFNQDHHGIHLESYLDFAAARQKKSFVTLHLLHQPTLPGTSIKRKQLAQRVVDAIRPAIRQWPGYVFRAGAYGQQPFAKRLDGTQPDFAAELSQELSRLCQLVGPVVDQVLAQVLDQVQDE